MLREHVGHCRRHSPFYRELLAQEGVEPDEVTLENLSQIPPTDKAAFARRNDDFLAVPAEHVVDIVLSSGTTGAPTTVMYSENDLRRLAYNEATAFAGCGVARDCVALLTCTIDRCFIAGLAYQMGLRQIGASVIRNGNASLQSHFDLIRRLSPTVLVGVPTFLRKLALFFQQNGADPAGTPVRKLVCIGEPLRDAGMAPLKLGADIESLWNAEAFSTYATSETVSSFCECTARNGGHLIPELAVVEIVDDSGRPLPPGAHGEVVITPLNVEAMPLLRFKTGDISFLMTEPCPCGRVTPRLGPILGRKSQMIKLKGTTLYPQSILSTLSGMAGVTEYYVVATSEDHLADQLTVHAAVSGGDCSAQAISERLQAQLRVRTNVIIEPEEAVARQVFALGSRKAVRFVDRRTPL
jgi:phenylacetate-CoA ligase